MTHAGTDNTVQTFNDIITEALLNRDAMFLENVATDNEVAKSGQIMAYGSFDRYKLVNYVNSYGYDVMNAFIADWRQKIAAHAAHEEQEEAEA